MKKREKLFVIKEHKDGHVWGVFKNDPFQSCRLCGTIRRADNQHLKCSGTAKMKIEVIPYSDAELQSEVWKQIPSCEGYEASNLGRIRSLISRHGQRDLPLIRKSFLNGDGYWALNLKLNRVPKSFRVHRLVLEAFKGACPQGMEGCHLDGNRANPRSSNLSWDTRLNNARMKLHHGTQVIGESCGTSKLRDDQVIQILQIHRVFGKSISMAAIGRMFKIRRITVVSIINNTNWTHINRNDPKILAYEAFKAGKKKI